MKDKILIIIGLAATLCLGACSYNELPPKTDDLSNDYVLPKGVLPTASERAEAAAAKAEYEEFLKK